MENKELDLLTPDGAKMTTASLISFTIGEQRPGEGVTYKQMRERFQILDILEAANGKIEMSDAQWKIVKERYETYRFAVAHHDIVAVGEQLEGVNSGS